MLLFKHRSGKGGAGGRSSGLAALMSKAEGKKLEASTLVCADDTSKMAVQLFFLLLLWCE